MKNKEWLKEKLDKLTTCFNGRELSRYEMGRLDGYTHATMLLDELDEPELTQDQVDKYLYQRNLVAVDEMVIHQTGMQDKVVVEKPIIPKFVADYVETLKNNDLDLALCIYDGTYGIKVSEWLFEVDDEQGVKNRNLIMRAWLNGYNVEKEKEHYDYNNRGNCELQKEKKYYVFDSRDNSYLGFNDERTELEWHYYTVNKESFTEAEIKDIDEKFWAFAEEV